MFYDNWVKNYILMFLQIINGEGYLFTYWIFWDIRFFNISSRI